MYFTLHVVYLVVSNINWKSRKSESRLPCSQAINSKQLQDWGNNTKVTDLTPPLCQHSMYHQKLHWVLENVDILKGQDQNQVQIEMEGRWRVEHDMCLKNNTYLFRGFLILSYRQCCPDWSSEGNFITGELDGRWVMVGWSDGQAAAAGKRVLHL